MLGGGVAGLAAALALARDGHRVTLVERDEIVVGGFDEAPGWRRAGIPHFLQPHAFIPRGRLELLRSFPEVYASLLAVGAHEVDTRPKMPGEPRDGDEDLTYLAVRRPVIEWALRRAVLAEPAVTVAAPACVDALLVEHDRVTGLRVDGAPVEADVIVDALGRRTPMPRWIEQAGLAAATTETTDCEVVYYSRYYRVRPGFELPDGPWFLSPRGDLGYLAYATFPGDNGTFAALLAAPTHVPEWKALKDEPAFETAVGLIPALRSWVDPDGVEPITGVMAMAGLRNSLRGVDGAAAVPVFPVGDAYGHTDPVLAHGLAFALVHAREVASALAVHADPVDALQAYVAATGPALRERFEYAGALDAQRHRMWVGEPVDFAHHDGDYALFTIAAAGAAAVVDPDIARVFLRRIGLLDSTLALDADLTMRRRIEAVFAEILRAPRAPAGPSRAQMLAALAAALQQ